MKFYRARFESRNFDFDAYGVSAEDARQFLIMGLITHAHQHKLTVTWFSEDDITVHPIAIGKAYRDRVELPTPLGGMHLSDPNSFKGAKR